MKNPFFFVSIGLLVVIVGFGSFQMGKQADDSDDAQEEVSPIVAVYNKLSPKAKALYFKQSKELTQPVHERLVELDEKKIGCFGAESILGMATSDKNLGGQCCGTLTNHEAYAIQLNTIQQFIEKNGGKGLIPDDPYDLSVTEAQRLTRLDTDIVLTADELQTFDDAVEMSHHGGPCCCKCWKWYVMSGLAKELIQNEGWNKHQIAEMWDISSSCGHQEDTDMSKHYDMAEGGMDHADM